MLFSISLYVALAIFCFGVLYKVWNWFRLEIGDACAGISTASRLASSTKAVLGVFTSSRILSFLEFLLLEVLFQRRLWNESKLRWFMHICIYWGFMLLLTMHALEDVVTASLFEEYASTLNPFLFLRNLFGLMVIVGLGIAGYRRARVLGMRITSSYVDYYALAILAVIMVSGILLESIKIVSPDEFYRMVEEYSAVEEGDELDALKAYWVKEFGMVFPDFQLHGKEKLLEAGLEIHESDCAACHSRPQWAFLSYGVSRLLKGVGARGKAGSTAQLLWYIHFLACFIGLAYMPFSKFFHILASPVSLLSKGVRQDKELEPPLKTTRRAMELDACTHCAICTQHCSVWPSFSILRNKFILPSEKLVGLKSLARGNRLSEAELRYLREGAHICTSCYRCTDVCPVGIDLQDLWFCIKEDLAKRDYDSPYIWARETTVREFEKKRKAKEILALGAREYGQDSLLAMDSSDFSACFGCQTCTNVCPVVADFEKPGEVLGLLPHQIMYTLGLELVEQALSSRMPWDCLTCYLCQEQCPQSVPVADVLYGLRNLAYQGLRTNLGNGRG